MSNRSVFAFLATLASAAPAWAQTSVPAPVMPSSPAAPSAAPGVAAAGSGNALVIVGLIAALVVLVAIGVKLFDLKRKRTAEAVHLQAQVSDALLRDETLVGLAITPTAYVPFWTGQPATIEVSGSVPNDAQRETSLRLVQHEATRIRPDVRVVDRLTVRELERAA